MSPRNPKKSPEEKKQGKVLQTAHDVPNPDTQAPVASVPENTPALKPDPEQTPDTKAELDRVALYLKGPTVFTA